LRSELSEVLVNTVGHLPYFLPHILPRLQAAVARPLTRPQPL